ncbi:MAG: hypothetical protein ACRDY7_09300, partial [Acidimicrobiia bacterium]
AGAGRTTITALGSVTGMVRNRISVRVGLGALSLALGVLPLVHADAAEGAVITNAAGDGDSYGDGGPATEAELAGPRMIAFDGRGGYYIADTFNNTIRHVDDAGVIRTYAGTGAAGHRDGPAAQAQFNKPHSVDVDAAGTVIVGDPMNDAVRMIDTAGNVTTIAGTPGDSGYEGDGGPATSAHLNDSKIALVGPDGNIYVADYGNSVIRRIRMDLQPRIIETFAGNEESDCFCDGRPAREAFFKPRNITFDIDGDLLVADRESNTVRSIAFDANGNAGVITTIAGVAGKSGYQASDEGGPALEAELFEPRGLGVDWMGNVYIADSSNNRVRRVDTDGRIVTVAGNGDSGKGGLNGPPKEADLNNPRHVIFDAAGNMYITDTGGHRILVVENFIPPAPPGSNPPPGGSNPPPPAGSNPPPPPGGGSTPPTTNTTRPGNTQTVTPLQRPGYWMLGSDGAVYPFGQAKDHGGPSAALGAGTPAVDLEATPAGDGYWVVDAVGRVFDHGAARHFGELAPGQLRRGEQVTSLSATPSGKGYWIFTSAGRVLGLGDAAFFGDMGDTRLNAPVLDSVPTPSGRGYYMVAGDGGIFTFGDANFWGSMGGIRLNAPVQSLVPDPDGKGYWLVASDGGVFSFEAGFRGSMGNVRLNQPMTGMVAYGDGYLMVAEDGGIFNFGPPDGFKGSLGNNPPANPVVSVAALD